MANIDRIVKSLDRMRAKLIKAAETHEAELYAVGDEIAKLNAKAAEHRRSKGRAENIAENLSKLLGS